jgi:hypothetical protein
VFRMSFWVALISGTHIYYDGMHVETSTADFARERRKRRDLGSASGMQKRDL